VRFHDQCLVCAGVIDKPAPLQAPDVFRHNPDTLLLEELSCDFDVLEASATPSAALDLAAAKDLGLKVLDPAALATKLVNKGRDSHVSVFVGYRAKKPALWVKKMVHPTDLEAAVMNADGHAGAQDSGDHGLLGASENLPRGYVIPIDLNSAISSHKSNPNYSLYISQSYFEGK
jgi:hypothetical protein